MLLLLDAVYISKPCLFINSLLNTKINFFLECSNPPSVSRYCRAGEVWKPRRNLLEGKTRNETKG